MALNGIEPDFAPQGDLSLKAWFGNNQGLPCRPSSTCRWSRRMPPYDAQITRAAAAGGAVFIRQSMKDASGATVMDPATQVTSLHGISMLDAAKEPFEVNLCLAILREPNGANDNELANLAIAAHVNLHRRSDPGRRRCRPRGRQCAQRRARRGRQHARPAPGRRRAARGRRRCSTCSCTRSRMRGTRVWLCRQSRPTPSLLGAAPDPTGRSLLAAFEARGARSVFVRYLRTLGEHVTADAVLAAFALTLAWGPLQRKRISRRTALNLPWYLALYGTLLGAAMPGEQHGADSSAASPNDELLRRWTATELAGLALTGRRPGRGGAVRLPGPARACCSPTARARSRPRVPRARSRPTAPRRRSGCRSTRRWSASLPTPASATAATGSRACSSCWTSSRAWISRSGPAEPWSRPRGDGTRFARSYRQEKTQRREAAAEGARAIPGRQPSGVPRQAVNHDPRETFVAD